MCLYLRLVSTLSILNYKIFWFFYINNFYYALDIHYVYIHLACSAADLYSHYSCSVSHKNTMQPASTSCFYKAAEQAHRKSNVSRKLNHLIICNGGSILVVDDVSIYSEVRYAHTGGMCVTKCVGRVCFYIFLQASCLYCVYIFFEKPLLCLHGNIYLYI